MDGKGRAHEVYHHRGRHAAAGRGGRCRAAKNSVLPILAATLLSGDVCRIEGCPHLSDVDSAADILRYLGCAVQWDGDDLLVDSTTLTRCDIPQTLMRRMRSSVIFLGAILARCGWAELSYPGGCELGPRPIDLHLAALRALGADIDDAGGTLPLRARKLTGCRSCWPRQRGRHGERYAGRLPAQRERR